MIKSADNKKIKLVRSLFTKKNRDKLGLYIAEGETLVDEYASGTDLIEFILVSEDCKSQKFVSDEDLVFSVEKKIFKSISNTSNSQGILAVVRKRESNIEDLLRSNLIVFIDALQDPGNMGTIIRSADAFNALALVVNKGCVDVYNPKTVRSAMGSMTRVSFYNAGDSIETLEFLKEKGYGIYSAVVDGDSYMEDLDYSGKSVIVIGNEGIGVSDEIKEASDVKFSIRMTGKAESLNAGVAASICLYKFSNKMFEKQ
ncbi:RNA methyltransferase, TrmH family [Dethiosulfatibacter aminovorans DSM 17477]|uniref:RNA methyltransferase, TrmH family n=1 Tax=Dethiosulfatibacter aminovorans DSM 17477 TaxID=1121476 RepID=A0A1M6DMG3_9FIRM|nr:RNA methyltransferase [Dethiosulfatibacter aminovorans]SHI74321.1 RNA methyltransferase, TrmH family [Dethiosulfatibacter aminovorans DSM 17477]